MEQYSRSQIAAGGLMAVVGAAVVIWLLVAGAWGCTVMNSCDDFDDHEYCVEDDCVCGDPCSWQSCHGERVCVRYLYEASHGVCVPPDYQESYDLPLIGSSLSEGDDDG